MVFLLSLLDHSKFLTLFCYLPRSFHPFFAVFLLTYINIILMNVLF